MFRSLSLTTLVTLFTATLAQAQGAPADSAKEAADTAKEAADTAKEAADTAKKATDTAKKAADTAKEAADTAKEAADTAKQAAQDAPTSAPATAPASAPATKPVPPKLIRAKPMPKLAPKPHTINKTKVAPKKAVKKPKRKKGKATFLQGRVEPQYPLSTDRPGNTDTASTVAPLNLQIETGFFYRKATVADRTFATYAFPTSLRFGIIDGLEIRLRSDIVALQKREGEDLDVGGTDTVFGFRVRLLKGRDIYVPTLAVQFELGIPTGSESFTNDAVVPELQINANFDLFAGVWLALNTDIDATNDAIADEVYWRWGAVAQLGYRPAAFNKIAAYVDIFSKLALDRDRGGDDILLFSGGLTYQITIDAQVDAWGQIGLNDNSGDFALNLGFSYRL